MAFSHSLLLTAVAAALFCALLAAKTQTIDTNHIRKGEAASGHGDFGAHGPSQSGEISPDFQFCDKGHQRPINLIIREEKFKGPMPEVQLYESVVEYKPRGNNFQLDCIGAPGGKQCSTVTYNGERYHMMHAQFRSPSEHHIDGSEFPLEMQLVHKSENGDVLLVLGILFNLGNFSEDIQVMFDAADEQGKRVVEFSKFLDTNAGLCTYKGSLSTPPCTQGVHWMLSNQHPVVSLKQIGKYRAQVQDNISRSPVQPVSNPEAKCFLNPKINGRHSDSSPIPESKISQGAPAEHIPGTNFEVTIDWY